MKINTFFRVLFSNRTFPAAVKFAVTFFCVVFIAVLMFIFGRGIATPPEMRMLLHFCYITVFAAAFFCGAFTGICMAAACSVLAVEILIPGKLNFSQVSLAEYEVFLMISLYFIIAISVDWFRSSHENLVRQMEKNQQLFDQARQIEKLAVAGEIAAGIAHEIRNPLTVIHGYIQLLLKKIITKENDQEEIYTLILNEITRTNSIISDFLQFSRPGKPNKSLVNINAVIESAISLFYGEALRNKITIHSYLDPQLPEFYLDREQFMQVLLNLFANAIQSMPKGGSVSILTAYDRKSMTVATSVSDSGEGIPKELLPKIFTPFFTTREHGTGLGLAITGNIVANHGGLINVESSPGQGSRFTVTLPVVQENKQEVAPNFG